MPSKYDKMAYWEIFKLLGGREAAYNAYFDGTISDPDLLAEFENKCYGETTAASHMMIRAARRLEAAADRLGK